MGADFGRGGFGEGVDEDIEGINEGGMTGGVD